MFASGTDGWSGSSVVSALSRGVKGSTIVRWVRERVQRAREFPEAFGSWAREAAVASTLTRLSQAVEHSGIARAGREGGDWAAHSFLYRWLTTEPEPDVVVIDLRETLSAGPVIWLLDRVVDLLVPYWAQSVPGRVLDVLISWGERAADTRAGRLLVAVLEPPEPAERADDMAGSQDSQREDGDR